MKINEMKNVNRLVLLNKQKANKIRYYELMRNKKKILEVKINNMLEIITRGDTPMLDMINTVLDKIGYKRTSNEKLNFLTFFRSYNIDIIRDAIGAFLFNALDRYDPEKGTKKQLFLAILRTTNSKTKTQRCDTHKTIEDRNNYNDRLKYYLNQK